MAVEHLERLFLIRGNFLSRYRVWGYQSILKSRVTPRYFICENICILRLIIEGCIVSFSLFLVYIGISAVLSLEIISLFSVHHFYIICSAVSIKLRMSGNE